MMCCEELPEPDERSDDVDTHLDGSLTVEHVSRLDGTMFSERVRKEAGVTMFLGSGRKMRPVADRRRNTRP